MMSSGREGIGRTPSNENRRCSKCHISQHQDRTVSYYFFPYPGKTNILKARFWAKYCWPNNDWLSMAKLVKLCRSHKLICSRHFEANFFSKNKKLDRFALPGDKNYLEKEIPKHRRELYLMKNDANIQDWSIFLWQLSSHMQDHTYVALSELHTMAKSKSSKLPTTSVLNPTAAKTVAQSTTVEQNHKIYNVQTTNEGSQSITEQNTVDAQLMDTCLAINDYSNYSVSIDLDKMACQAVLDAEDEVDDLNFDNFCRIPYDIKESALAVSDKTGINVTLNDNCHLESLKETSKISKTEILTVNSESDDFAHREYSLDASVDKLKDNDELLVPADDEDVVTVIDNDDDYIMDLVSSIDIAENPDCNGDEEDYVPYEHQGFCCNVCLGKIVGFRYRCCECEDYDMCSDCESRGEHPLHYVLRVPGYRKQCEIRRVMAAVNAALALPEDVKDELVIKIEDSPEELLPDPLDTGEIDATPFVIDPANPEPMEVDTDSLNSLDILASCEVAAPSPDKTTREIPTNQDNLKIIAKEKDISVVLDALHRKAVVRLENMPCHSTPHKSARAPLVNRVQQNGSEVNPIRTMDRNSQSTGDFLKNISQGSLQSRLKAKRLNIPAILRRKLLEHSFTSNKQCDIPQQSLSPSQCTEKKKVIIENVTANRENILVKVPTDVSSVPNRRNIIVNVPKDVSGVPNRGDILVNVPTDVSSVPNRGNILVKVPKDVISVLNRANILVKVPKDASSVLNTANILVKVPKNASSVLNRANILVKVPTDDSSVPTDISSVPNRGNILVNVPTDISSVPNRGNIVVNVPKDVSSLPNSGNILVKVPTDDNSIPIRGNILVNVPTGVSSVPNGGNIVVNVPKDVSSLPNRGNIVVNVPTDVTSVPNIQNISVTEPRDDSSGTNTKEVFSISEEDFKALMAGSNLNDIVLYETASMTVPGSQQ